jgi:hemerythrin
MSFALWDASMSTGNDLIDDHHRHLIDLLNQLYEQITTGDISVPVEKIINELIDYATYHFAAEERYMRLYKYPQVESHLNTHLEFTKKTIEYQDTLLNGENVFYTELAVFLKDWLFNHIKVVDSELGRYLKSKGVF